MKAARSDRPYIAATISNPGFRFPASNSDRRQNQSPDQTKAPTPGLHSRSRIPTACVCPKSPQGGRIKLAIGTSPRTTQPENSGSHEGNFLPAAHHDAPRIPPVPRTSQRQMISQSLSLQRICRNELVTVLRFTRSLSLPVLARLTNEGEETYSGTAASELFRSFSRARDRIGPIEFSAIPSPTPISW